MALKFEVYEGSVENLGTVTEAIGKKGKIRFATKSMKAGNTKRLVVILTRADGTSLAVTCSEDVSNNAKNALEKGMTKEKALAIIAGLDIVEDTQGRQYVGKPMGESTEEEFAIETLVKIKDIDYADFATQKQLF